MRSGISAPTRAYTLIELVAVLAIVAVMVTIAAPRFSNSTQHYRAALAAKEIASVIHQVRTASKAGRRPATIEFDTSSSVITVTGVPDPLTQSDPYTIDLTSDPYRCTFTKVDIASSDTLSIDGWGVLSDDGIIEITAGSVTRQVTVSAVTGNAEVTSP